MDGAGRVGSGSTNACMAGVEVIGPCGTRRVFPAIGVKLASIAFVLGILMALDMGMLKISIVVMVWGDLQRGVVDRLRECQHHH